MSSRRWYWKAYLGLMTVLTVVAVGMSLYFWKEAASYYRIADWASLPMFIVQLVGLYGFVYGRRIGSPFLWRLVFAVTILEVAWSAYDMASQAGPLAGQDVAALVAMLAVVGGGIYLPLLVALFIYAFRSPALWGGALNARG